MRSFGSERDLPEVTLWAVAQLGLRSRLLASLASSVLLCLQKLSSIQNGKEQKGAVWDSKPRFWETPPNSFCIFESFYHAYTYHLCRVW